MVVRNHIAKLNDNNCRNIEQYMLSGMTATEAFTKELIKNRHNPYKIKGFEYRNDKWFWLFKLLEIEQSKIQYIQSC